MQKHPKAKHAVQCIQCEPVGDWDGLVHIDCAYGRCDCCPEFKLPKIESESDAGNPLISFHSYENRSVCSFHDILGRNENQCVRCNLKPEGEPRGKLSKKTKLIHERLDFLTFFSKHYLPALQKFKKHRFQYIILSKNHTGSDSKNIVPGEVWTQRDFSERLTLQFNHQAQLEYYSGGATISLEGVAVKFFRQGNEKSTMEFHTYLSDGKQQDSAVVNNHMEKLIVFLRNENVLKPGGHIYCHSDGCASQYRCSTAYYFLSALAYKYKISISRIISASGHGKFDV